MTDPWELLVRYALCLCNCRILNSNCRYATSHFNVLLFFFVELQTALSNFRWSTMSRKCQKNLTTKAVHCFAFMD